MHRAKTIVVVTKKVVGAVLLIYQLKSFRKNQKNLTQKKKSVLRIGYILLLVSRSVIEILYHKNVISLRFLLGLSIVQSLSYLYLVLLYSEQVTISQCLLSAFIVSTLFQPDLIFPFPGKQNTLQLSPGNNNTIGLDLISPSFVENIGNMERGKFRMSVNLSLEYDSGTEFALCTTDDPYSQYNNSLAHMTLGFFKKRVRIAFYYKF